jgi:hypothetical protein
MFLLVTAFVLGLFPNLLAPFTTSVSADEAAQADRVARRMIANLSMPYEKGVLNATRFRTVLGMNLPSLRDRYGLPSSTTLNVTARRIDTPAIVSDHGDRLATVAAYENQTAASEIRLITLHNGTCSEGCRLVVRTW